MTKTEILDETIAFYTKSPELRGIKFGNDDACVYNGKNEGQHCAVGRCMLPKYKEQGADMKGNSSTNVDQLPRILGVETIDDILEERYRGHSLKFWTKLQHVHDKWYDISQKYSRATRIDKLRKAIEEDEL